MARSDVYIVRTGTANVASVAAAMTRLNMNPCMTSDASEVSTSPLLILPGVGTLAAAMAGMRERDLIVPLRDRLEKGMPTLAICLGMQLFCEESEESPDVKGLGLIGSRIDRFPDEVRVPQLGWNRIDPDPSCRMLLPGHCYFANSYRLQRPVAGWATAMSDYGGPFVAGMEKGAVLACQFHPELSGELGLRIIGRWLELSMRYHAEGGISC